MLRASAFPFIMARVPNRVARFVNAISSIYACLGGGKESSLILYASIFWQFRSLSHCSPFDSQPSPCCIHHGGLLNLFCLFVDAIHTFFSCHHTQFFPLFIHILVFFLPQSTTSFLLLTPCVLNIRELLKVGLWFGLPWATWHCA